MRYWVLFTALALVTACNGGDSGPLEAANLSAVPTSNGQTAVAGSRAAQPLAVQAKGAVLAAHPPRAAQLATAAARLQPLA